MLELKNHIKLSRKKMVKWFWMIKMY